MIARTDYEFFFDPSYGALPKYTFLPLLNDSGPNPGALRITAVGQLTVPAGYTKTGASGTTQIGKITIAADGRTLAWDPGYCLNPTSQYWYCSNFPPFPIRYTVSDGVTSASSTLWITFNFPIPAVPNINPWQLPILVAPPKELDEFPLDVPLQVTKVTGSVTTADATTVTFTAPCSSSSSGWCEAVADIIGTGGQDLTGTLVADSDVTLVIDNIQVISVGGKTGKFVHFSYIQRGFAISRSSVFVGVSVSWIVCGGPAPPCP